MQNFLLNGYTRLMEAQLDFVLCMHNNGHQYFDAKTIISFKSV